MKRIFVLSAIVFFIFSGFAQPQLHAQDPVKWRVFHSSEGAFSVEMPQEPKYLYRMDSTVDAEQEPIVVKTHMFMADGNYGTAYFVAYYGYPPGFIIANPSDGFTNMATTIAESMGGALAEMEETEYDGYPAAIFLIRMLDGVAYRGRFVVRSGRIYFAMAGANDQMLYDDEIERFFTSFRFKDFIHLPKKEFTFREYGFSVKFPAEAVIDSVNTELYTIQSLDTSSAVSYMVIFSPLNEYFEAEHADSVLKTMYEVPAYMPDDTLLRVKKTTYGGYPAHEVDKMTRGTGQVYRFLYVLRDDAVYTFFVFLPKNMIHTAPVNEFFSSVKFLPHKPKFDIYTRKAALILKDIASPDTLQRKKALNALGNYEFRENELPLLYKAVLVSYPDDTLEYGAPRVMLLEKFTDLSDSATVPAINAAYTSFPTDAYSLKRNALQTLRSMNTKQSLELLTELIVKENLPSETYDYSIYNKWNDTLNNYRYMFPGILNVFKKDTIGNGFYMLLSTALDSNIVSPDAVKPHLGRLVEDIKQKLETMQRDAATKDSTDSGYYTAAYHLTTQADILGRFADDAAANKLLKELLKTDYAYLTLSTAMGLLKAGTPVEPAVLQSLAADSSMRLMLWRSLDGIGAAEKFPVEYYTQRAMSLGNVAVWLNDDHASAQKIEYLGEYDVPSGKTEGRYFLYKFMMYDEEGDEAWYTAISGPQPLDRAKVNAEEKRTYSQWNKLDEMTPEQHFKTLLEATEKWDEE